MANYYISLQQSKLTGPSSRKIASNKDGAERKRDKKGRVHLSIYSAFPPSTTLTSNLSSFFCTSALRTTITPITTLSLKQFKFTSAIICCLHTRIYIYIYVCISRQSRHQFSNVGTLCQQSLCCFASVLSTQLQMFLNESLNNYAGFCEPFFPIKDLWICGITPVTKKI